MTKINNKKMFEIIKENLRFSGTEVNEYHANDFENAPESWECVFNDERSWDELTFEEQEERKQSFYESLSEICENFEDCENAIFINDDGGVMVKGYDEPWFNVYVTEDLTVYDPCGSTLTDMELDVEKTDKIAIENDLLKVKEWEFDTLIKISWDGSNLKLIDLEELEIF